MTDMQREAFEQQMRERGHLVYPGRDGWEYSSMAVENVWHDWCDKIRHMRKQEGKV